MTKQHLWIWSGQYLGYRDGDLLFTHDGRNIGRFVDRDLFAPDGRYLGEVRAGRLVRNRLKCQSRINDWSPAPDRRPFDEALAQLRYAPAPGYEDFPEV